MTSVAVRRLAAVAEVSLGRQRSPEHADGPWMTPYLRAANVKDGVLDLSDVKEMNFTPGEREVFHLKPGDVLITEGAGSLAAVGAAAVWSGEMDSPVCFQNTLLRLRPRRGTYGRYLAWWARHAYGDRLFAAEATGVNIFHLSADRVRSMGLALPDVKEQRAIADFLDAQTARIEGLVNRRRKLGELASERLGAVVEHRVREAAASFGECPLKRAADIVVGIVITPAAWYAEAGTLALRGLNVKPGRIDLTDTVRLTPEGHLLNQKSELRANDVVVVRTGQAGSAAVIPLDLDGSNCIDLLRIRPSMSLDPRFLENVLNSDWTQKHISEHSVGSIQAHFNVGSLKELPIPLPPLEVQRVIVEALREARNQHELLRQKCEAQLAALQERKQALITAAVTGQLDLAREIAEEAS